MKVGVGSYTFTWAVGVPGHEPDRPLGPSGLLKRARALGTQVVQYCDNLPLNRMPRRDLERLRAEALESGISVEIGTRGLNPDALLAHLELAMLFGSPFLRVVIDAPGDAPEPAQVVARLALVLPRFEDSGVRLAIENHDRFPARVLARMVEELGPARVGICLDTVNSLGALESPEQVVRTLAAYTLNLHVKDFTISRVSSQMGFVVAGCPAGEGRLDVPWVLRELAKAGRDVNAIVELWTPRANSLEETIAREADWAERSVRYLREIIL